MTASPCVGVCRLDTKGQICVGCGRTLDEIAAWPELSESERRAILSRLASPLEHVRAAKGVR